MVFPFVSRSVYDARFFEYTSFQAKKSAQAVVPVLRKLFPDIESVADFGCGQGIWLKCWADHGLSTIQGIDGDYVDRTALAISEKDFIAEDLNGPIDLDRRFDLVYSLEVAEHLRPESSEAFVANLVRHADIVLFSAAPPGQGGESHINERPMESWRAFFRTHDYDAYDCVRPRISLLNEVSYWYRYNIILYAQNRLENSLPANIRATKIADDEPIVDISPAIFKLRKFIISQLPYGLQNALSRAKATITRPQ